MAQERNALIHENQYSTDEQNLEKKMKILIKKIPDTKGLVTKVQHKNQLKLEQNTKYY